MYHQTALFDLDGTLLNTLQDLTDSVNVSLMQFGYPKRTETEIRSFLGNGTKALIRSAMPDGCTEDEVARVLESYHIYYPRHCAIQTCPYPGVLSLLKTLQEEHVKTAIISNKPDRSVGILAARHFDKLVAVAMGNVSGEPLKPAPDPVLRALRVLSAERAGAVYIGDSEVDIETARRAEIDCIAVSWGFRDREQLVEAGAPCIVDTVEELLLALRARR